MFPIKMKERGLLGFATAVVILFGGNLVGQKPANAEAIDYARSGNWTIQSHFDDDGTFTRCLAHRTNGDLTVSLGINAKSFLEIWLYNPKWVLEEGENYSVTGQIDGFEPFDFEFEALLDTMGFSELPGGETTYNQLRRGNRLKILAGSETFYISLGGTSKALRQTRTCWDQGLNSRSKQNPFETNTTKNPFGNPNEPDASDDDDLTVSAFADIILEASNLRTQPFDRIPEQYKILEFDVAWPIPGGVGGGNSYPITVTPNILTEILAKEERESCIGDFSFDLLDRSFKGLNILTLKTACTNDGTGLPFFNVYSYYPNGKSGVFKIVHSSIDGGEASKSDSEFFKTFEFAISN